MSVKFFRIRKHKRQRKREKERERTQRKEILVQDFVQGLIKKENPGGSHHNARRFRQNLQKKNFHFFSLTCEGHLRSLLYVPSLSCFHGNFQASSTLDATREAKQIRMRKSCCNNVRRNVRRTNGTRPISCVAHRVLLPVWMGPQTCR